MNNSPAKSASRPMPPDQSQRLRALDPDRSILVQAPAGSGKTDLLTRRFLRLLAEVEEPGQVVAITFTIPAAAEMLHRVLAELEKAAAIDAHHPAQTGANLTPVKGTDFSPYIKTPESLRALAPEGDSSENATADEFSMEALARRALDHSRARDWNILDLPAQLRISTIDSFCRDLALQQPLLSGLGGGIAIAEQPTEFYRRAARQTLEKISDAKTTESNSRLSEAIEALLLWRDNNWKELEDLLVQMLGVRDRWMHEFVLNREPDRDDLDSDALRRLLERPFANAVRASLVALDELLNHVPGAREEALALSRFACDQSGNTLHLDLAELAEFPCAPYPSTDALEEARQAHVCLAKLLLTDTSAFRKQVNVRHGFPADRKSEKTQILNLIARLNAIPGLEAALAAVRDLPPIRYTDEDWRIVRACFTLLRHAAAQLKVVFAEAGAVDFIEVAQIALSVLRGPDGLPTDAAQAVADGIRHLLVDEFQDTSRRQHQLVASLAAAWPDRVNRTCFVVGDRMQSIYCFRDADPELFARVKAVGLELPGTDGEQPDPLLFDSVSLAANFRTTPLLVERVNEIFDEVFAVSDSSSITFSPAMPARDCTSPESGPYLKLHVNFAPQTAQGKASDPEFLHEKEAAQALQTQEVVDLIRNHQVRMELARAAGDKYRIAVLARARKSLTPIAQGLREAAIPFRAIELEKLSDRPEILDALALARALANPQDRVAWLGVLRAPWCGLSLEDLHRLTSADDPDLVVRPVPELLAERLTLLSERGRQAASRVLDTLSQVSAIRASQSTASLGTWVEQVWLRLGGADCVDATGRANVDLLWSCLDSLPNGEQDLLGPALNAALDKLTALPDPQADAECGVQLMTIHKSKGLEFEVVIVPDLQAGTGGGNRKLLSWLERGLGPEPSLQCEPEAEAGISDSDGSCEITEFLVAPIQAKGADKGTSKAWVDRVYRERESQETRRILYVATTRAREELHFFARPVYKVETDGSFTLCEPADSLLATAWPALAEEVRARFEDWKSDRQAISEAEETEIESIAASSENNILLMPSGAAAAIKPTLLRRLPPDYRSTSTIPPPEAQPAPGAPSIPRSSAEWVGSHEPHAAQAASAAPQVPDAAPQVPSV
jgi:ATP-dependent helicase/nuclease subunit A